MLGRSGTLRREQIGLIPFLAAKKVGDERVWVIDSWAKSSFEKSAFDLRDKRVAHLDDAAEVKRIEVTGVKAPYTLEKDGTAWKVNGAAGDAEDDEILAAQRTLARAEGVWAGPTGVATLAVLTKMLAAREVDPAQSFCVILSETGLKTEAVAPSREATAFDFDSLKRLVEERLPRA